MGSFPSPSLTPLLQPVEPSHQGLQVGGAATPAGPGLATGAPEMAFGRHIDREPQLPSHPLPATAEVLDTQELPPPQTLLEREPPFPGDGAPTWLLNKTGSVRSSDLEAAPPRMDGMDYGRDWAEGLPQDSLAPAQATPRRPAPSLAPCPISVSAPGELLPRVTTSDCAFELSSPLAKGGEAGLQLPTEGSPHPELLTWGPVDRGPGIYLASLDFLSLLKRYCT